MYVSCLNDTFISGALYLEIPALLKCLNGLEQKNFEYWYFIFLFQCVDALVPVIIEFRIVRCFYVSLWVWLAGLGHFVLCL